MTANAPAERPRRGLPLAWLLAVLVAHLLLLAWPLPAPSGASAPPMPPALQTRQVVLAPPPPPPASPVATPRPAPPRPAPARPRVTPAPAATPEPSPTAPLAAPEPPAADPSATEAGPQDVAAVEPQPPAEPEPAPESPPEAAPEPESEPPPAPEPEAPQPLSPPPPAQWPPTGQLSYSVKASRGGAAYDAVGVLSWRAEGERYELRLAWRAFIFSREQTSTGRLAPDGLHPERFAERTRSERAAHFDEAGGRVRFSANTPDAPLRPGAQDRLSLLLQLAARFNAQPEAFPAGTRLPLPVVGTRELEEWVITVDGHETLELPVGPTDAIKLQRLPRRQLDQKVEIWLAPALSHFPVRIRITDPNGDVVDQQLSGR